ncbi:MAG TPA: response regulator [Micropepsaceae bacterium]|nr:response regulator [Micropepsaceae bacterium]
MTADKVNILLVDDQPAKLLSYEVILEELDENLLKATSAQQALELLLKYDIAVILIDVCMPELDGFELAAMIRDHPRFHNTAIIFISAVLLTDSDRLKGYQLGGVDYVPVPVVAEVLRAKVKIFSELYRKTRELERLNQELEGRVEQRTAELAASNARLIESEQRRTLALAAGQMGSLEWDVVAGTLTCDDGQRRIFGLDPGEVQPLSLEKLQSIIHPDDWPKLSAAMQSIAATPSTLQVDFRVVRPNGEIRWCIGAAASTEVANGGTIRAGGVTLDITDRKEAEDRQVLLVREVDHRARNALAVAQSIVGLTRAPTIEGYINAVQGRIAALARTHTLLAESRWQGADFRKLIDDEMTPFCGEKSDRVTITGPAVSLNPAIAQSLALVVHELATNAAKYGALSVPAGRVAISWELDQKMLTVNWSESGGPPVQPPERNGFGSQIMKATIERQLKGTLNHEWRPDGLHCSFSFASENGRATEAKAPQTVPEQTRPGSGGEVMLVEDEALVGLMIADFLSELGYRVMGPFTKTEDAMETAKTAQLAAAVLDVNIAGEEIYPLAEFLQRRNVPFVFVTGYGADGIDKRFAGVTVLQKPVDREALRYALASRVPNHPANQTVARPRAVAR